LAMSCWRPRSIAAMESMQNAALTIKSTAIPMTKGRKYEVINLGVSSYTPVLEYIQLKEHIGMLKPDMVILNFDMTDVVDEYVYRKIASYDKTGDVIAVNGFLEYEYIREVTLNWIYMRLFITWHAVKNLRKHFDEGDINEKTVRTVVELWYPKKLMHTLDMPQLEEAAEMYSMNEDSIERAKELCDRYGCEFILSVYPRGHQVSGQEWVPGRYRFIPKGVGISDRTVLELERFSKAQGITFFNAFPYFREYKGGQPLYFSHDPHWTPAGQELMAKSLTKFLEEYLNKGE